MPVLEMLHRAPSRWAPPFRCRGLAFGAAPCPGHPCPSQLVSPRHWEGGRVLTCCPAPRRAEGQRHRALLQLPAQLQRLPHPAEGRGPRPHVRGQQGLRPLPRPARHQPRAPHCKLTPLGLGTRRGRGAGCPEGPSWWCWGWGRGQGWGQQPGVPHLLPISCFSADPLACPPAEDRGVHPLGQEQQCKCHQRPPSCPRCSRGLGHRWLSSPCVVGDSSHPRGFRVHREPPSGSGRGVGWWPPGRIRAIMLSLGKGTPGVCCACWRSEV